MGKYLKKFDAMLYKKITLSTFLIVPCVLLTGVLVFLITFWVDAQSTGSMLGEGTGSIVGRAIGSMAGLTEGQSAGYKAGKQAGLSGNDIEVELSNQIKEMQNLQVLVASGTFSDVQSVGDDYAVLLSMKYNAIFSVDLSTAKISMKDDGLHILVEQPAVEFIPVGKIEKRNEYQTGKYTGKAEDGYTASNNKANQMKSRAENELKTDESLQKSARISAQMQIEQFVNAVSVSKQKVFVEFE